MTDALENTTRKHELTCWCCGAHNPRRGEPLASPARELAAKHYAELFRELEEKRKELAAERALRAAQQAVVDLIASGKPDLEQMEEAIRRVRELQASVPW